MKLVVRLMGVSLASSAPRQTFGIAIYRPNSPKPLKGLNHLRRRRNFMHERPRLLGRRRILHGRIVAIKPQRNDGGQRRGYNRGYRSHGVAETTWRVVFL